MPCSRTARRNTCWRIAVQVKSPEQDETQGQCNANHRGYPLTHCRRLHHDAAEDISGGHHAHPRDDRKQHKKFRLGNESATVEENPEPAKLAELRGLHGVEEIVQSDEEDPEGQYDALRKPD